MRQGSGEPEVITPQRIQHFQQHPSTAFQDKEEEVFF